MATIGQWLHELAQKNSSTEQDSTRMGRLLRHIGYTKAHVDYGIVWLEGPNTRPSSIHSIARELAELTSTIEAA
jgi:hypothetical protein